MNQQSGPQAFPGGLLPRNLRKAVRIIGFALPFVLVFGKILLQGQANSVVLLLHRDDK